MGPRGGFDGVNVTTVARRKGRIATGLDRVRHCLPNPPMNLSARTCLLTPIVLALAVANNVSGADWPRWRGPENTGAVSDKAHWMEKLPAEAKVLWKVPAGPGFSSPVVEGDHVLFLDNQDDKETIHLFSAKDGARRWKETLDGTFKDSQGPRGPRCTPVLDGPLLFAQSSQGEFQCRQVADGKLVWRTNFSDFGAKFIGEKGNAPGAVRHGNNGSPLVDGDNVFVQVGGTNASVVCFQKKTGKVVWASESDVPGYAAPFIATVAGVKQLVSFTADGVIGLDVNTGKLLWRFPVKTAFARHVTTPVVVGDMVIVSSHQVGLIGIRVSKDGNGLKAEQAWLNKDGAMNFSSPIAVEGHIVGLGPKKDIVSVDAATGKLAWSQQGLIASSADKAHAGFIRLGGNVLMLSDSGELVLFNADPKALAELGRVQVCGANWCNPAFANGVLFLRDGIKAGGELMAVALAP